MSVTIEPNLDSLERIAASVEEIGQKDNWSADLVFKINIVLDELATNIVKYGGKVSEIEVSLSSEEEVVTVEITDDGQSFDPLTEAPEPDLDSSLNERRIGGLGVFFVRSMMDDLQYRREQGKNHLAFTKRRAG
jgi:anti-sigma regulatory factor (Ser/Thr protein kinase)